MSKFSSCVFISLWCSFAFSAAFSLYGREISLMNIDQVWNQGITGRNVTVAVVDDGVNYKHADLERNYAATVGYDFVGNDTSPLPEGGRNHGSMCAGVIAARFFGLCRTGVAYNANLAGIRLFNGTAEDEKRPANGLQYNTSRIDIFSNSWGPSDNGYTVKTLGHPERKALWRGTKRGRGGLGSIYVFATGNGGFFGDSCAFDGYVNNVYTIPIGPFSKNGGVPRYAERCSSVMAAAYGDYVKTCGGSASQCATNFGKSSAAAAFASGIIALALEANNKLTQRDIQHLIVRTSNPRRANIKEREWSVNGAGLIFHPVVGFGVLDAKKLVDVAKKYRNSVPRRKSCRIKLDTVPKRILRTGTSFTFSFDNCWKVAYIEHLSLELSLNYTPRAIMEMFIISPNGTKSKLLYERIYDSFGSSSTYKGLVVTSVHFWGEKPDGEWTVLFKASESLGSTGRPYGTLDVFKVSIYGTDEDPMPSSDVLPTGTIICGGKNRIWKGYGLHCCGSLWTYDPDSEICCVETEEIVSKNSQCGNTTYNKCKKICCDGQLSDKFQNNVTMSCCGRNTYDSSKQICCGGNAHEKFVCSKHRWWRGYYIHETRCLNGEARPVATEKRCEAPCKDMYDDCNQDNDCASWVPSSFKKKYCAKTCDLC